MKIAVCLSGQLRSVEKTFPFIKANILDINHPDVFIHAWYDRDLVGKSPVSAGGVKSSNPIPENIRELVFDLYNPVQYIFQPQLEFDELSYNQNRYPQIKPKFSLSQRYSVKAAINLVPDTYDIIFRMRFDYAIQIPVDASQLPLDAITVSNECVHPGGCSDQFAVGSRSNMKVYAQLFDAIPHLYNDGIVFCDEILVAEHLRRNNIPIHVANIPSFLMRGDGNPHERYSQEFI